MKTTSLARPGEQRKIEELLAKIEAMSASPARAKPIASLSFLQRYGAGQPQDEDDESDFVIDVNP